MKGYVLILGKAAGVFVTATGRPFVHEWPRGTATARPFVHEGPRRATKGHEELQLQKGNCRTATFFFYGEAWRAVGNWNCKTLCPRMAAGNCNCKTLCPRRAAKGHEGPRRTATAEGQLQNCNIFFLWRGVEGRGELELQDLLSKEDQEGLWLRARQMKGLEWGNQAGTVRF